MCFILRLLSLPPGGFNFPSTFSLWNKRGFHDLCYKLHEPTGAELHHSPGQPLPSEVSLYSPSQKLHPRVPPLPLQDNFSPWAAFPSPSPWFFRWPFNLWCCLVLESKSWMVSPCRERGPEEGRDTSGWCGTWHPRCDLALGTARPVLGEDREAQAEGLVPKRRGKPLSTT